MDEFQLRLVQLGLERLAVHGFALAGGFALQAHGLLERLSEDVDFFTDRQDPDQFSRALDVVTDAYRDAGLDVAVTRRAETFARLETSDPITGQSSGVDLAADFRSHQPVVMALGPVIAEADAVGAKVAAVFSRAEARDYLDLAAILLSGRYDPEQLIALAGTVDLGFSRQRFAEALVAVDRFEDDNFTPYGVDHEHIAAVRQAMQDWGHELLEELRTPHRPPLEEQGSSPGDLGRRGEGPGIGL